MNEEYSDFSGVGQDPTERVEIAATGADEAPAPNHDALLITNGYVPIAVTGKRPVAKGWETRPDPAAAIIAERAAFPNALSTGLLCGPLVGVDNDLVDHKHAGPISSLILEVLGSDTMLRFGRKGVMLCYRNQTPIGKIIISGGAPDGTKQKVEFLGSGQQFVAYGIHPDTGKPYAWLLPGDEPLERKLSDLPEVTPDQLRQCARAVVQKLLELGFTDVRLTGDIDRPSEPAEPPTGDPVSADQLRDMLSHLDPDCDRELWRDIVAALHAAPLPDDEDEAIRRELAHEWSRGDLHGGVEPAKYVDAKAVDLVFDSMKPKPGDPKAIHFGTLVHAARTAGYTGYDPAAKMREQKAKGAGQGKEGDTTAGPRVNRFKSRAQSRDEPDEEYLIEGLCLPSGGDSALIAPSQYLKTFAAVDLGCSIATGMPALGQFPIIDPGPVFYLAGEGSRALKKKRITAWEIAHGLKPFSIENLYVADMVPLLGQRERQNELIADAKVWLAGRKAKLVINDTLNRSLNGFSENDAAVASQYLEITKRIREELGDPNYLTIHHTGYSGERGRGSSALPAAWDAEYLIPKHEQDEVTKQHTIGLKVSKLKDDEDGQTYWFKSKLIDVGCDRKGKTLTSLVLMPLTAEEVAARPATTGTKHEDKDDTRNLMLQVLREIAAHGDAPKVDKEHGVFADDVASGMATKKHCYNEFQAESLGPDAAQLWKDNRRTYLQFVNNAAKDSCVWSRPFHGMVDGRHRWFVPRSRQTA